MTSLSKIFFCLINFYTPLSPVYSYTVYTQFILYTVMYTGRIHKQGAGLVMIKEAAKSCLGWEGINNRIVIAHFNTKSLGYQL